MILPDELVAVGATAWAGLQAWTLIKLTGVDKKLALIALRMDILEGKSKK